MGIVVPGWYRSGIQYDLLLNLITLPHVVAFGEVGTVRAQYRIMKTPKNDIEGAGDHVIYYTFSYSQRERQINRTCSPLFGIVTHPSAISAVIRTERDIYAEN